VFLDGEETIIVSEFGKITDAFARFGVARIDAEKGGAAAGGRNETEQNVHCGSFAGAIWAKKTKHFTALNGQRKSFNGDFCSRLRRPIFHAQILNRKNRVHATNSI